MALDSEFWLEEFKTLFTLLLPFIVKAIAKGGEEGISWLPDEISLNLDQFNAAARDWAEAYSYELVTGITETTQKVLQGKVSGWIESGEPLDELIAGLEPVFGDYRAQMIAATEVTRAFAEGNLLSWRQSGVVSGKMWMTAEDELVDYGDPAGPCLMNQAAGVVPLNQSFPSGDDGPPSHPHCRCWLHPVISV